MFGFSLREFLEVQFPCLVSRVLKIGCVSKGEPEMTKVFSAFLALALASAIAASAQTKKPRIAVGGISAESNSLYPKARTMPADPPPANREEWIELNLKASETTSGIVEAAPKVGLDV